MSFFSRQQQSPCLSSHGNSSHRVCLLTATVVTVSVFSRQQQSPCLSSHGNSSHRVFLLTATVVTVSFFSRQQQSPWGLSSHGNSSHRVCLHSHGNSSHRAPPPPPTPQHQLKGRVWRRQAINLQSFSWGGLAAVSCRRLSDNRSQQLPLSYVEVLLTPATYAKGNDISWRHQCNCRTEH